MQVLESARKKVAGLLGGIEQIDDAVFRGERRYQDKTFAVAYVDFADDVVGRAKGLRAFQERILGDGYFSSPGDLRWNKSAPIGLILCAESSREPVEFLQIHKDGITVAEYWPELPPKAELEQRLHAALLEARERLARRGARLGT